jgi:predicted Zn-dependent protease
MCVALSGCAGTLSGLPTVDRSRRPAEGSTEPSVQQNSRAQAALQLTEQGRALLASGKTDDAISILERSVGLDPTNGQSYYYLAEAWIVKRNLGQAEEFNRLADLYLRDDFRWRARVTDQRQRIERLKGL